MSNKITNFDNIIILRDFLNNKLNNDSSYFLKCVEYIGEGVAPQNLIGKNFANIQLIWGSDQYYLNGEVLEDEIGEICIPFNDFLWDKADSFYTITYDLDGGVLEQGINNPSYYYKLDRFLDLENPQKVGYDFLGWTTDQENATPSTRVKIYCGEGGNKYYKANWEIKKYTVEINPNNGLFSQRAISYIENNKDIYYPLSISDESFFGNIDYNTNIIINNPQKAGYNFENWVEKKEVEILSVKDGYTEEVYTINNPTANANFDNDGPNDRDSIENKNGYTVYKWNDTTTKEINLFKYIGFQKYSAKKDETIIITGSIKFNIKGTIETETNKRLFIRHATKENDFSFSSNNDDSETQKVYYCTYLDTATELETKEWENFTLTRKFSENCNSALLEICVACPANVAPNIEIWLKDISIRKKEAETEINFSNSSYIVNNNTSIKAKWSEALPLLIHYDLNNGAGAIEDESYIFGDNFTTPDNIIREGYNLIGWNTKSDGMGVNYIAGQTFEINENLWNESAILDNDEKKLILYANWQGQQAEINFDLNCNELSEGEDSEPIPSKTVIYGDIYGYLPIVQRDEYDFLGWVISGEDTLITENTIVETLGDHILYAKWRNKNFYLNINGNLDEKLNEDISGYGSVDIYIDDMLKENDVSEYSSYWPRGHSYELKDIKPLKGHYYETTEQNISGDFLENVELTLNFKTKSYTVTYDLNSGSGEAPEDNENIYYDDLSDNGFITKFEIKSSNLYKEGYSFVGWTTEPNGGLFFKTGDVVEVKNIIDSYDSDLENGGIITLYAKWQINKYKLIIDPAGGEYNGTEGLQVIIKNYGETIEISKPEKIGCEFLNWDKKTLGVFEIINQGNTIVYTYTFGASDDVLRANWREKEFIIKFDNSSYYLSRGGFDREGIVNEDISLSYEKDGKWIESLTISKDIIKNNGFIILPSAYTENGGYYYYSNKYCGEQEYFNDAIYMFPLGWTDVYQWGSSPKILKYGEKIRFKKFYNDYFLSATGREKTEITLYTIWSENYGPLEACFAYFQNTYMLFDKTKYSPVRTYYFYNNESDEYEEYGFYKDKPIIGFLPAQAERDSIYFSGEYYSQILADRAALGLKDITLDNKQIKYEKADLGLYAWVIGGMADSKILWEENEANDFSEEGVAAINKRYYDIISKIFIDPYVEYQIYKNNQNNNSKLMRINLEDPFAEDKEFFYNLPLIDLGIDLVLKDIDLDYCLTEEEILEYSKKEFPTNLWTWLSAPNTQILAPKKRMPVPEEIDGEINSEGEMISFLINEGAIELDETEYPKNLIRSDYSFNNLKNLCDEEIDKFKNIATEQGSSELDSFLDSEIQLIRTTINYDKRVLGNYPSSIYSIESFYNFYNNFKMFLPYIYNNDNEKIIKHPSFAIFKNIICYIAVLYSQLEVKERASYKSLIGLAQDYLRNTWGKITSRSLESLEVISRYFYHDGNDDRAIPYYNLNNFINSYFSAPDRLRRERNSFMTDEFNVKSYRSLSPFEQKYIDGQVDKRSKNNNYYNTDNLSIDGENGLTVSYKYNYADYSICGQICTLIDSLIPIPTSYASIYGLLKDYNIVPDLPNPYIAGVINYNAVEQRWDPIFLEEGEPPPWENYIDWVSLRERFNKSNEIEKYLKSINWNYNNRIFASDYVAECYSNLDNLFAGRDIENNSQNSNNS